MVLRPLTPGLASASLTVGHFPQGKPVEPGEGRGLIELFSTPGGRLWEGGCGKCQSSWHFRSSGEEGGQCPQSHRASGQTVSSKFMSAWSLLLSPCLEEESCRSD